MRTEFLLPGNEDAELNGLIRFQIKKIFYNKVFREGDTRKAGSVKAVYMKEGKTWYIRLVSLINFKEQCCPVVQSVHG